MSPSIAARPARRGRPRAPVAPAALAGVARVRDWALWSAPAPVRRYVLAVEFLALGGLVVSLVVAPVGLHDVVLLAALTGCGLIGVEASRHLGAPSSVSGKVVKDLLGAWTVPAAILLAPACAMLAPVPAYAYAQWRVTRMQPMKRVFNTAAVALALLACHVAFRLVAGGHAGDTVLVRGVRPVVGLIAAAVVDAVVAALLVAGVMRRAAPGTPWRRTLLATAESFWSDAAELCLAVMIAVLLRLSPVTLLFAVPPVLLLQRGLLHSELQTAARTDAKTGLANPRHWRETAERALLRARRDDRPTGVLLIDVDHFKRVNDTYGHLAGDTVLLAVADAITADTRPGDLAGRYGGEEFTLLLPEADTDRATAIAERIRDRVAGLAVAVRTDEPPVRVSVSVGVATAPRHGLEVEGLLAAADSALYAAKHAGRNRTRVAAVPPLDEDEPAQVPGA